MPGGTRDPSCRPSRLCCSRTRIARPLLAADVQIEYRQTPPHYDAESSPTVFKEITIEKGTLADGLLDR